MSNSLAPQFVRACSSGKINELTSILYPLSFEEKNEIVKFDNYACFHLGATNGHRHVVDFIFEYIKAASDVTPEDEAVIPVFLDRKGEGFKAALAKKHIDVVERILEEEYLFQYCTEIIIENAIFIETIWNSNLKNLIIYIFAESCSRDILSVQRILDIVPQSSHHYLLDIHHEFSIGNTTFMGLAPFKKACASGKLDIMQLLWDLSIANNQQKVIEQQFESTFILATKNGYLDILKQLVIWVTSPQLKISLLTSEDFNAFIHAADIGSLEILRFIWDSLPPSLQLEALKASNFAAYRLATKNHHLQVMHFLEEKIDAENRGKMKNAVNQGVISPK